MIYINKVAKSNFLNFQTLAILNSILPDNLLMYDQPNSEALWAYLQTLIETSGLISIFAHY